MPKVSIIVPVYNVEKYLPKCLDSLISQTFQDIEIICVNDGSTDNSLEILNSYAEKDSRIKIVNKQNGGLFSARHEGMKYIDGEYLIFVDSDDWVSENLVEKCLTAAGSDAPDIVVFGAFSVREKNGNPIVKRGGYDYSKIPCKFRTKMFGCRNLGKDLFKFPPTAWSKMYRTDFINKHNIRFQEIKNGEDQLFFIHSMLCANKIKVVSDNLYYYIKSRAGAITAVNKKKSLSPIYNVYEIEALLNSLNIDDDYKKFILGKYFEKSLSWYTKASEEIEDEFFEAVLKLQNYLNEKYPKCWWTKLKIQKGISYLGLKLKIIFAKYSWR